MQSLRDYQKKQKNGWRERNYYRVWNDIRRSCSAMARVLRGRAGMIAFDC